MTNAKDAEIGEVPYMAAIIVFGMIKYHFGTAWSNLFNYIWSLYFSSQ